MSQSKITADQKIIEDWKLRISEMTREELLSLQRHAPAGHPVFNTNLPLYEYFDKRFHELGGMSPEISKKVGW